MTFNEMKEDTKDGIKKVSVGVSVKPEVKIALSEASEALDINMSQIVERLIVAFLDTREA